MSTRHSTDSGHVQAPGPSPLPDPSCPVKGMYCLLYLITELRIDKIVIAQQSLHAFIDTLSPGAYASITKINFKKPDNHSLKPLGVYGSKEEIVRFLREIHAVDDNTAGTLLAPQNGSHSRGAEPILRSGLYVVRSLASTAEVQAYVVYWPEDTTWNDQAVSIVQRNRVMFMRYLTKLCDQIVCLLSSEHSQAIVWDEKYGDNASTDSNNDDSGRVYDFVVAKTNYQEENVVARPGFTLDSPLLVCRQPPPKIYVDRKNLSSLSPTLLYGETKQGVMTAEFKLGLTSVENFIHRNLETAQIRLLLGDDVVLCLSEKINDESLETLMSLGPSDWFPKEFATWKRRRTEIMQRFERTRTERQREICAILEQNREEFIKKFRLREAVIMEVLNAVPSVPRKAVLPESSTSEATRQKVDTNDATHPLYDFFRISPKTEQTFRDNILIASLEKGIQYTKFQIKKERILILYYLLETINDLDRGQIRNLANAVLCRGESAALKLLKVAKIEENGRTSGLFKSSMGIGNGIEPTREEALWRDANNFASSISDSRFFSQLNTTLVDECFHDAIVDAEETAHGYLRRLIESLVKGIGQRMFPIRKEDCEKEMEREITPSQKSC